MRNISDLSTSSADANSAKPAKLKARKPSGPASIVAHPHTKLRDLENLLRFVKRNDDERGIE